MSISCLNTSCHQCRFRVHCYVTCIVLYLTYIVFFIQEFKKSKRVLQLSRKNNTVSSPALHSMFSVCDYEWISINEMDTHTVTINTRSVKDTWRSNYCFISETRVQVVIQLRVFWLTSPVVVVCVFLSRVRKPHQTFSCWESLSSKVVWRYLSDLRASHSSLSYHTIFTAIHTVQDTKYHVSKSF